jgi:threonine synthase
MFVAQAAGCSPIVNAFQAGSQHVHPVSPNTIASSIAIGNPADGYYALRIARQSGGGAGAATDEEAIQGIQLLAQTEGIFTEAAGGVVIATLRNLAAAGIIKREERTVAFITGAGPRTQDLLADTVQLHHIEPTVDALDRALQAPV